MGAGDGLPFSWTQSHAAVVGHGIIRVRATSAMPYTWEIDADSLQSGEQATSGRCRIFNQVFINIGSAATAVVPTAVYKTGSAYVMNATEYSLGITIGTDDNTYAITYSTTENVAPTSPTACAPQNVAASSFFSKTRIRGLTSGATQVASVTGMPTAGTPFITNRRSRVNSSFRGATSMMYEDIKCQPGAIGTYAFTGTLVTAASGSSQEYTTLMLDVYRARSTGNWMVFTWISIRPTSNDETFLRYCQHYTAVTDGGAPEYTQKMQFSGAVPAFIDGEQIVIETP